MPESTLTGHAGDLHVQSWEPGDPPRYLAVLVHGYGEHIGRYEHVALRLVADGAAVYGLDHLGHGRSSGERVLIPDFEPVVGDLHALVEHARGTHPGLPVVMIGHSMGGMIAARYAQRYGEGLACVVLSGPVLGRWDAVDALLAAEEIPDVPIDPSTLSRDPSVGQAYVADDLVWHGPFKRPTLEGLSATIATIEAAGAITRPVLWLHGEEDQLVPIEGSRVGWQAIRGPEAEQRSYSGARHEIFNETNQDEVLDDVLEFVHRRLSR
ncbi:alpha/beta hydrolase [Nocardioides sambongensis]|uniref:alpha/beta hydrolase n=1 Tax=Nocardioides sambongensis TaxID=2589074 RepID=UPI001129E079|nr:alpha/beta hydrolase [Nocardioides sambongensis]